MAKLSVTFRLEESLVERLRDTAARSGGKLTQAAIVEAALTDKFAVRDSGKLLSKVNESQQTALTLVKEQSQALTNFQMDVSASIGDFSRQVIVGIDHLQKTTQQELSHHTASIRTMQSQMATFDSNLQQIDSRVEHRIAQASDAVGLLQWLGLAGFIAFSLVGLAAVMALLWQRFG